MNSEAIIRTKCYLCDGPIQFPAELTNQIIPCPHCQKEIKLFGAMKAVPRWRGALAMLGTPWNLKQKIVAALFVLAVVVSLFNAPWEIRYRSGLDSKFEQVATETGSVFEPPNSHSYVTGYRLMLVPMLFKWAGFLAISGVLLCLLKTRDTALLPDKTKKTITIASVVVGACIVLVAIRPWDTGTQPQKSQALRSPILTPDIFDEKFPDFKTTVVEIPGVGEVKFVGSMSQAGINAAVLRIYREHTAPTNGVLEYFRAKEPTLGQIGDDELSAYIRNRHPDFAEFLGKATKPDTHGLDVQPDPPAKTAGKSFTFEELSLDGMALIPAGSFWMGDSLLGSRSDERAHTVEMSAFYMDRTEVTKALWDEVKGWSGGNGYSYDNPGMGKAPNHPVQTVNWYDVVKWCNARSQKEGRTPAYYTDAGLTQVYKTGKVNPQVKWNAGYRLPTEAEWEKAARGGASGHRFPWADTDDITHSRANYTSDSAKLYDFSPTHGPHPTFKHGVQPYTSPVGYFAANGYGLCDMAGNVKEWCWDWYSPYSSGSQADPRGPSTGSDRVVRGGGWGSDGIYCGAAHNSRHDPALSYDSMGFRSVLPPSKP